jgi:ATP-dependent Clp protease ATP-binding subunit ClpA
VGSSPIVSTEFEQLQVYRSRVQHEAWEQARLLDDGWIGTEHFLLALLATPSIAQAVLLDLGVRYDAAAQLVGEAHARREQPLPRYAGRKGVRMNPAAHQLMGRAEAFAAASGHRQAEPEHWLLALVWSDRSATGLLAALGATQAGVLEGLRRRGVSVPDVEPPRHRPWREGQSMEVNADELRPIIDVLIQRHPPGSEWRWGCNAVPGKPTRRWVIAEQGIDLDAVVRDVRERRAE